jgi:hypothetical protein
MENIRNARKIYKPISRVIGNETIVGIPGNREREISGMNTSYDRGGRLALQKKPVKKIITFLSNK